MNEQTRYEVESRFNGEFQALTVHSAWSFFVRFAKDVRNRACNVANFDSQCDNSFIGGMIPHDLSCDPICEPSTSDFNSFSPFVDGESHLLDYAPFPQYDDAHVYNVNDPPSSSSCSYMASNDFPYASNESFYEGNSMESLKEEKIMKIMEMMEKYNEMREVENRETEARMKMLESQILQLANSQENALPSSSLPHMSEDPITEHSSDGEGVENENSVDFENPNPSSHLDESQVYVFTLQSMSI